MPTQLVVFGLLFFLADCFEANCILRMQFADEKRKKSAATRLIAGEREEGSRKLVVCLSAFTLHTFFRLAASGSIYVDSRACSRIGISS